MSLELNDSNSEEENLQMVFKKKLWLQSNEVKRHNENKIL